MPFLSRGRRHAPAALAGIVVSLISLAGCSPKPVAAVAGSKLTEAEFAQLCETATQVNPQAGTVGMQVLQQWIQNTVLAAEAKAQGLYPSQDELNAKIESFKKQSAFVGANFDQQLASTGMSLETFKRMMLTGMVRDNLLFKGVEVSDAELQAEYDKRKKEFTIPEQLRISQITTLDLEKAKRALSDLATNTNFGIVASTYSKDRFAQNQGQVPFPVTTAMESGGPVAKQTVDAAFKLKEGQVSDPIKIGTTYVLVRVDQRTPAKVPSLDDVKELIRNALRQQKAQQGGKLEQNQGALRTAFQNARPEIFRTEYKALAQAPSAAVPGQPGAPPGAPPTGEMPPAPPGG